VSVGDGVRLIGKGRLYSGFRFEGSNLCFCCLHPPNEHFAGELRLMERLLTEQTLIGLPLFWLSSAQVPSD
jgi:hypothetical protein